MQEQMSLKAAWLTVLSIIIGMFLMASVLALVAHPAQASTGEFAGGFVVKGTDRLGQTCETWFTDKKTATAFQSNYYPDATVEQARQADINKIESGAVADCTV